PDCRNHVVDPDPAVVHRVRDLVEHDELVLAVLEHGRGERPSSDSAAARLVEIRRLPREAVAAPQPLDAEPAPDRLLADFPLAGLDELDHADAPAARDAAHYHAEG